MPPLDDAYLEELLNTQFGGATANQLMGGGGAPPPPAPPQAPDPETTAPYTDDTPPPPSPTGPGPGAESNEAEASAPWQEAIESAGSASPTLSSGDTGVDYFSKIEGLQKQGGELIKGQRENAAEMLKIMRESNAQMAKVPIPQMQSAPQAPKADMGRGMLEFAQVATILGAMAGGLGRRNTTAALNAFSGAITGFAKGNRELFEAKSAEWKQAAEQVKADNQAKLDQYDLIWKNNKMTMDQKLGEFKVVAAQYGDEITYNLAQQRDYMMLAQSNEKEKQFMAMYDLRLRAAARADKSVHLGFEKYDALKGNAEGLAEGIMSGNIPPDQLGSAAEKPFVLKAIKDANFNLPKAQAEWAAVKKLVMTSYGQQMVKNRSLGESVVNTIDEVEDLSDQMKQGGFPLVNNLNQMRKMNINANSLQGQLTTRYIAAVNTLKEEFANLAQGGYAPTEPAWKLADQQINAAFGNQQMLASLKEIQRLIRFRFKALEENNPVAGPNRYAPGMSTGGGLGGGEAAPTKGVDMGDGWTAH